MRALLAKRSCGSRSGFGRSRHYDLGFKPILSHPLRDGKTVRRASNLNVAEQNVDWHRIALENQQGLIARRRFKHTIPAVAQVRGDEHASDYFIDDDKYCRLLFFCL